MASHDLDAGPAAQDPGPVSGRAPASGVIALWALLLAAGLVILRSCVLLSFSVAEIRPQALALSLLRLPAHAFLALLVGRAVFGSRRQRLLGWSLLAIGLALELAAFHYEASFGELPGIAALRSLEHFGVLSESIAAQAPWGWLLVEYAALCTLAGASASWLRRASLPRALPRWFGLSVTTACAAAFGVVTVWPSLLGAHLSRAAQEPLGYFARDALVARPDTAPVAADGSQPGQGHISLQDGVRLFQAALGHIPPFASGNPAHPLCGEELRGLPDQPNRRNLLLLLLEGIGQAELHAQRDGKPLMPRLSKLASEVFEAENFFAAGTQSAQALPAIFAGMPAQAAQVMMLRKPLPQVEGLPAHLAAHGYVSSYFHGGDLSFEQQRPFLKALGFDELHELELSSSSAALGWGEADGVVLQRLQAWLSERQRHPAQSFLAAFAGLSTHHPFRLPSNWQRSFDGSSRLDPFHESLRYVDEQVGTFVDAFRKSPLSQSTYLIITGDHAPLVSNTEAQQNGTPMRYDVPLLVLSPDAGEQARLHHARTRLAGHADLAATLSALVGVPRMRCDQGLNLFQADPWPARRLIYASGGRGLGELFVRTDHTSGRLSRATSEFELLAPPPPGRSVQEVANDFSALLSNAIALTGYLHQKDAYAPRSPDASLRRRPQRSPLPAVSGPPLLVSHRGNTDGSERTGYSNGMAALEDAIRAGMRWIEIDLSITRDGDVVLEHDPVFFGPDGRKIHVETLSLEQLRQFPGKQHTVTLEEVLDRFGTQVNFCLEAKPQVSNEFSSLLAHRLVSIVKERRAQGRIERVIFDSFSLQIASSLAKHCECPVGLDTDFKQPLTEERLRTARDAGLDWLYVHEEALDADAIRRAHQWGFRVMAYTINEPKRLAAFAGEWPDGIITDSTALAAQVKAAFAPQTAAK